MLILVYLNILQESTTYIVTLNINSDMTLPLISHLVSYISPSLSLVYLLMQRQVDITQSLMEYISCFYLGYLLAWQLFIRHFQIPSCSSRYYGLLLTLQVIGYCSFCSNIVRFSIDQSVGASTDELSAIIYWHSASLAIIFVIFHIVQILIKRFAIVYYVLSGMAVSAVIISNSLFKHWLDMS